MIIPSSGLMRPTREFRQLVILDEIGRGGPITQRSLARRARASFAMVNADVDDLVGRGCVEVSGETNRSYRYRLTPQGRARCDELFYRLAQEASDLHDRVMEEMRSRYADQLLNQTV